MAAEAGEGVSARLVPASERKLQDVGVLACYGVTLTVGVVMGFAAVGSATDLDTMQSDLDACEAGLNSGRRLTNATSDNEFDEATGFAILAAAPGAVAASLLLSMALGALWLWGLKTYTRAMVWGTVYLTIGVQLALAVWLLALGNAGAIFLLILVALYCLIIYCIRDSINLSADLLQLGVTALNDYPAQLLVNGVVMVGTLLLTVILVVFMVNAALVGSVSTVTGESGAQECDFVVEGWAGFTQILLGFLVLWTLMAGMQVAQFSAAYMAGEWYFNPPDRREASPSWTGLRLALTLSAGSNLAAGLVLAVIQMIRNALRQAQRRNGGLCMAILACLVRFLLSILEFMTNFATIITAVTGQAFVPAAKAGSTVLKHSFVDGYITDRYSKRILYVGSVVLGLLSGFIAWALLDSAAGYNSMSTAGGLFILVVLLVLMGPVGTLLGALVASSVTGQVGVAVMAGFLGSLATTVGLFLSETLIDLTASMFAFWAIDRYSAVTSFGSSPAMVSTLEGFAAGSKQLNQPGHTPVPSAAAPQQPKGFAPMGSQQPASGPAGYGGQQPAAYGYPSQAPPTAPPA